MGKNEYVKWVLADAFAIAEIRMREGDRVSVQEIWDAMQAENEEAERLLNQGGAC